MQTHSHDVVYYGVVNLVHDNYIIGAIDVWRCRSCPQIFCEDKRYGVTDLAPEVGLPKIEPGAKWAALICTRDKGSNWTLTQAKSDSILSHSCTAETKLELKVGPDFNLESGPGTGIGQHRMILVESFINSAVDVRSGQKHTTTTNAYQALGKPFSFTPPLSAAVIEPSRYNILNLTTIFFIATGVWTGTMAIFAPGVLQTINGEVRALFALATVGILASTFFLSKRKIWSPILGVVTAAVALVLYALIRLPVGGLAITDYALSLLLLVDIVAGWMARERIKGLIEKQWHPLDMPAYG